MPILYKPDAHDDFEELFLFVFGEDIDRIRFQLCHKHGFGSVTVRGPSKGTYRSTKFLEVFNNTDADTRIVKLLRSSAVVDFSTTNVEIKQISNF